MSRFYVVEFRQKRHARWRVWRGMDALGRAKAVGGDLVRLVCHAHKTRARVLRIDTDAMKIEVVWEGVRE